MKKAIPLAILLAFLFCSTASAGDPMRTRIRTRLPDNIQSVGAAAQYYADVIGYRLLTANPAPNDSHEIANRSINPLFNENKVLPVEEAILAVLDMDAQLVIDHKHKLFAFEKAGGH